MKLKFTIIGITILTIAFLGFNLKEKIDNTKFDPWTGDVAIARSFGSIDDISYTGSLEAFEYNYNNGFRTFQCNLQFTSDNHLVVIDDWNDISANHHDRVPSLSEFEASLVFDKYTPVSFIRLIKLMKKYRDTYIVADFRDHDAEDTRRELEYIQTTTKNLGLFSGPGRIIINIYSKEQLDVVREYPEFNTFIYNTDKSWNGDAEELVAICNWLLENGIQYISINADYYSPFIASIPNAFLVHPYFQTENILYNAQDYLNHGAWGVYTDCLTPYMLSKSE